MVLYFPSGAPFCHYRNIHHSKSALTAGASRGLLPTKSMATPKVHTERMCFKYSDPLLVLECHIEKKIPGEVRSQLEKQSLESLEAEVTLRKDPLSLILSLNKNACTWISVKIIAKDILLIYYFGLTRHCLIKFHWPVLAFQKFLRISFPWDPLLFSFTVKNIRAKNISRDHRAIQMFNMVLI